MNKQTGKTSYELRPIGFVRGTADAPYFQIEPPFRPALKDLEQFSHVTVIWWADQLDIDELRQETAVELPYAPGVRAGIFATRSPVRPNPVCITTSRVLEIDEAAGILRLAYIDAAIGTPLLDVKAYMPVSDRVQAPEVATWMQDWPEWLPEEAWSPEG
jgi:tRNA-Thr(GGU) m(6)t(6)A37 methyltransferase TsaA